MTEVERKLLLWCGMMLTRSYVGGRLVPEELAEIEALLAEVVAETPISGIPSVVVIHPPADGGEHTGER
jgi:hypothetical protein